MNYIKLFEDFNSRGTIKELIQERFDSELGDDKLFKISFDSCPKTDKLA